MKIGLLLPHIYTSNKYKDVIFAPKYLTLQLAEGLMKKNHSVRIYTSGDMQGKTTAEIIPGNKKLSDETLEYYRIRNHKHYQAEILSFEIQKTDFENDLTLKAYEDAQKGEIDIIHSMHDFSAHYFNELTSFPTVYTLHDPLPPKNTVEYLRLERFANQNYISISHSQRKGDLKLNFVENVYNGVDLSRLSFQENPQDYIVFCGRMVPDKGVDIAIQVALKAGINLCIATSSNTSSVDEGYYKNKILPYIDGKKIRLFEMLSWEEKSNLLRNAKAFIFPLQWDEPFGLTMVEAMACGTPVVAFDRGSVSELVEDGVTGFVVPPEDGEPGIIDALSRISSINRSDCRKRVEENFTIEKMVDNYLSVYGKIVFANR